MMSMSVPSTAGKRPGGIKRKDARARPPESDEMESDDMESGEAARYEGTSLPIGPIVSGEARPAASRTGGRGAPYNALYNKFQIYDKIFGYYKKIHIDKEIALWD